jgi:hypothetical protein
MNTLRRLNILTVGLAAYVVVLAVCQIPYAWAVALVLIMGLLSKKG